MFAWLFDFFKNQYLYLCVKNGLKNEIGSLRTYLDKQIQNKAITKIKHTLILYLYTIYIKITTLFHTKNVNIYLILSPYLYARLYLNYSSSHN